MKAVILASSATASTYLADAVAALNEEADETGESWRVADFPPAQPA